MKPETDEPTDKSAGERRVLRALWEHHWWSLELLLAEARTLDAEEFGRELQISYGSFHGALAHLVGSEQVWLERVVRGQSVAAVPGATELPDLVSIESAWARCAEEWRAVIETGDLDRIVRYANTKGAEFQDPVWRVLTHLVDHGAAYRGILITALRLLGRTPPATGLMFYTRQRNAGLELRNAD